VNSSDFGGVNLSEWALRHRAFIFFLMVVCMATGLWAYAGLGRSEDPPFTVKVMLVKAVWPGATITDTVNLITDKLEKKLEEVPNLDYLQSQTKAGETIIYVTLKESIAPHRVSGTWDQVRNKIQDVWYTMPPGTQGPFFNDEFGETYGIICALTSDGFTHREMRDYAEKIRARLLRVPEVSKVDLIGTMDEKIYIEFSVGEISNLGVNPNELIRAIQAPNLVLPAGIVTTDNERIVIRVSGAYRNEDDVARINLHTSKGFVRLGDLATVVRRYADPPTTMFRYGGKPAIGLAIAMTSDGDILRLGKTIRREVAALEQGLPHGLDLHLVADQAEVVTVAVDGFMKALFEAIAIVLAVGFLALGLRAGLVVAVAIPIVLAITFAAMFMAGIALQRISLGALIISLGLLVDDAMITVEMMIAKLEEGMDRERAASYAYTTTAFPMLTGTLVTAVSFIPVGFARSNAGEYTSSLFWVIVIALLTSWFAAILFSPVVGVYVLPKQIEKKHHADGRFTRLFRRALLLCMHHRYAVIVGTVALFAVSVWGATKLDQQFFPASDRPELVLSITLPQSASLYATQRTVDEIEKLIGKETDVLHWTFYLGRGAVRFYLPLEPPLPNEFTAQAVIVTKNAQTRERVRARLVAALNEQFPDIVYRLAPLELGPPVGWPIKYRVSGEDQEVVRRLAFEAARIINSDIHIRDVNFNWNEPIKVVRVNINQDKANQVGLTSDVLAWSLNSVLTGLVVTQVRDATYLVDTTARSKPSERIDLATIRELQIQVPGGRSIPLSDLASLEYIEEQPVIWRRKRLPTITIQADLAGAQSAFVVRRLEPKIRELRATAPDGYTIEVGGIVEESANAEASIAAVVPVMLIIMLTLLMMQLQSFQRVLLVVSVAPLGLIGVVATMLVSGTPMGFIATLGVIALIGIIIRNSVILIDQIDANVRVGQHPWDAVLDATMHRLRPIVLTAAAAILGMLPIALDVFWGPMAFAMIGGLAVATLLTLIFFPALYLAWFRVPENVEPQTCKMMRVTGN
jgi:multidrug efflux pump